MFQITGDLIKPLMEPPSPNRELDRDKGRWISINSAFAPGRANQRRATLAKGVTLMNWDRIEGNWKQLRGKVQQQWGKRTDEHRVGWQDPGALRHRQGRGREAGR
jgi:hypothetical protein